MNVTPNIESSIHRLFPNMSVEQALTELLLERAQKNLLKYQAMDRHFRSKYNQDFDAFRQIIF